VSDKIARVDEICERFEESLDQGSHPKLLDFLPSDPAIRAECFMELLRSELEYAYSRNESTPVEALRDKYSEFPDLVEGIVSDLKARHINYEKGDLIGGYQVQRELGKGQFGTVYLARDPNASEAGLCAIKVIRQGDIGELAKAQKAGDIPGVVRIRDFGQTGAAIYLVMDYIEGSDLRERIQKGGLSHAAVVRIMAQIASTVNQLHAKRLYHRDLKPANILIDDNDRPFVTDFGLSASMADILANPNESAGSLHYASPEQLITGDVDGRSDVWALGVILYEALTKGVRPFNSTDEVRLREQIKNAEYKSAQNVFPGSGNAVSKVLSDICDRCLRKDKDERISAAELESALLETLAAANPFKGLENFEAEDADRFCGRDDEIEKSWSLICGLFDRSVSGGGGIRLLGIIGPSGSGKSSLMHAGLHGQKLQRTSMPDGRKAKVISMTPGRKPLYNLARALLGGQPSLDAIDDLVPRLMPRVSKQAGGEAQLLWDGLERYFESSLGPNETCVLLLDQFEQMYTRCTNEDLSEMCNGIESSDETTESVIFLENLFHSAANRNGNLTVILTLRCDFLGAGETKQHIKLSRHITTDSNHVLVTDMGSEELCLAIRKPLEETGFQIDEVTELKILDEVSGCSSGLPLLQYALAQIWIGQCEGKTAADTYKDIGGVTGALTGKAQEVFGRLDENERRIAKRVFLNLIQLGEDGQPDSSRSAFVTELLGSDEPSRVMSVIERFAAKNVRLLTISSHDELTGEQTVRLTHEALLTRWDRLVAWRTESNNRDQLRFRRQLKLEIDQWKDEQDDRLLLRSPRLDRLREVAEQVGDDLNDSEVKFLAASIAQEDAEQEAERLQRERDKRISNILKALSAVLAVSLVAVIALGSHAFRRLRIDNSSAQFDQIVRHDDFAIDEAWEPLEQLRSLSSADAHDKEESLKTRFVETSEKLLTYGLGKDHPDALLVLDNIAAMRKHFPELQSIDHIDSIFAERVGITLFELKAPFANLDDLFQKNQLNIVGAGDASYLEPTRNALYPRRTTTTIESKGNIHVNARLKFDQPDGQFVIHLDSFEGKTKYQYLLRQSLRGTYLFFATLDRGNYRILREAKLKPVKRGQEFELTVTREANQIRFEFDHTPIFYYSDIFETEADSDGRLGFSFSEATGLLGLSVEKRSGAETPLAAADELFLAKNYKDAAIAYKKVSNATGSPSNVVVRFEAIAKLGMCQRRLDRLDDAESTLTKLWPPQEKTQAAEIEADRWQLVAGAELFGVYLEKQKPDIADTVLSQIQVSYNPSEIAKYWPDRIWDSLLTDISKLQGSPASLLKTDEPRSRALASMLKGQRQIGAPWGLRITTASLLRQSYAQLGKDEAQLQLVLELIDETVLHTDVYPTDLTIRSLLHDEAWLAIRCHTEDRGNRLAEAELHLRHFQNQVGPEYVAGVLMDRARIAAAREDYDEALQLIEDAQERFAKARYAPGRISAFLVEGFVLDHLGRTDEAKERFKKGYQYCVEAKENGYLKNFGVMNVYVLSSLSQDLKDEHITWMIDGAIAQDTTSGLLTSSIASLQRWLPFKEIMLRSFSLKSKRGREYAERIAMLDISPADSIGIQFVFDMYEMIRIQCFDKKEITPEKTKRYGSLQNAVWKPGRKSESRTLVF